MLTKEQCVNALFDLKNQLEDVLGEESENIECVNVLNQLIDEHFKLVTKYDLALNELVEMEMKLDNPPLEFEELKEGMLVWDNKHHTYIKIDRIWESYNKTIYFYAIGWECCENTEYEPNRFYRKEVQE